MKYLTMLELIDKIEGRVKTKIYGVYTRFRPEMHISKGSQHNHQAWDGGYIDHVVETMNIARLLYHTMNDKRKLPFTLSEALVVMFLHDIEKAFPVRISELMENSVYFTRPKAKSKIKYRILHEENIWEYLNDEQKNALDTCEGENDSYSNSQRIMHELGAFCHMCDVASARLWHDRPANEDEPWGQRNDLPETPGEECLWGV